MPTVRHASVVLVSPSPIEPRSVRPETLSGAKIIPASWTVGNQINSPVFAVTQYQNGISIQIEGNRCIFQETIGGPLRPKYEIHNIARDYLEATRLVPYSAVGINWLLDFTLDNPAEWITKQVGDAGRFPGFSPTSLQLTKPWGLAVCNLIIRLDQQNVAIDCNYHFQLNESLQPMAALDKWRTCQEALTDEVLPELPD
jgi:hypothetical protein